MAIRTDPAAPGRPLVTLTADGEPLANVPVDRLRELLASDGAILLRGFDLAGDGFSALGRTLCPTAVVNDSPNRREIDGGARVYSVDLGVDAFPLHAELAREPFQPDIAMFGCVGRPSDGGETTLCDGEAIVAALPADLRAAMESRRAIYLQAATPALLDYWLGTAEPSDAQLAAPPSSCPYRFRRAGPRVVRYFTRALFRPSRFRDAPAFASFILFARDYLGLTDFPRLDDGTPLPTAWVDALREAGERHTFAHAWQDGDVLLLDNRRFMHGRRRIEDPRERSISTLFGYVDFGRPDPEEPVDAPWRRADFVPPGR